MAAPLPVVAAADEDDDEDEDDVDEAPSKVRGSTISDNLAQRAAKRQVLAVSAENCISGLNVVTNTS